ncbi:hypothetical protein C8J57DRAFT_1107045, partial [Mycena rebaudengoi]
YYDRSIIVTSERFDFAQETARFITMLNGLARLSEKQWGYHPLLSAPVPRLLPKGVLTHPFNGSDLKLKGWTSLTMGESIYQSHGIIGRGTCVSRARMEGQDVIGKWRWPATTRTAEAKLLETTTHLATKRGDTWVHDHLPKILHAEEREFDEGSPHRRLAQHFGDGYELRVLRIVVQDELSPITELTTAAELGEAFHGIFRSYRWLYENSHIMHRDISLNNLMYLKINGKVCGALNDFDLSDLLNQSPRSTSKHRTGTAPYMSVDLLVTGPPPPHLYRFDLESLFYVIVYIVYQYHEGKKIDNPPLGAWDHLPTPILRTEKVIFLATNMLVRPTSNFRSLRKLILLLHMMFREGYHARTTANALEDLGLNSTTVDNDTLGGHVTFDKFEEILKANLS